MFAAVRGLSSLFDMAGLYIMVSLLTISEAISKLVVAMLAAILNYGFSKRVIFRKRKTK